MSGDEPKVNVELSRLLYNLEYEDLIARKTELRKQLEEEERRKEEKKG